MTIIIGLSGHARHGKNTTVHLARVKLGDDKDPPTLVRSVSLGDALKQEARETVQTAIIDAGYTMLPRGPNAAGITRVPVLLPDGAKFMLNLDDLVDKTQEGRQFLQYYGTEYRRSQDSDYWVKRLYEQIERLRVSKPTPVLIFVPDVRFRNEADFIRGQGGHMVRVNRFNPDGTGFDNGMTPEQKNHPSETGLDGYDGFDYIINTCNIQGVWENLCKFLKDLKVI